MSSIRPASRDEIPAIASLWMRATRNAPAPVALQDYFAKIYFDNPWIDLGVAPLVHVNSIDAIDGFVGLSARPMTLHRRAITAAVSSGIVVAPESRGNGIGTKLRRESFNGPQDFTFCDGAAPIVKNLWTRSGGEWCQLSSCDWTLPLRPAGDLLRRIRSRAGVMASVFRPVAAAIDIVGAGTAAGPYRMEPSNCRSVQCDADAILEIRQQSLCKGNLAPEYDGVSLGWILADAARATFRGILRQAIVLDASESPVGWYVYHAKRNDKSMVLQIGAKPSFEAMVLNRLINDARSEGAQALYGQLDSRFTEAVVQLRCNIRNSSRFFFYTRDSEIRQALHSGRTDLSWLDGEWWLHFSDGPW